MPLIQTTPPSAEPTSLADAKAHLRIYHSDDDDFISTLITTARRMIERRFDLSLLTQHWSLCCDAWPCDGVFKVPLHPLLSVTDIVTYGEDDTPATLDPSHYYVDAAAKPARISLRPGRSFAPPARSVNGIEVKLVTGFGANADSVPGEIRQAILMAVADWYSHRGDEEGVKTSGVLPAGAVQLLQPYRTVRLT